MGVALRNGEGMISDLKVAEQRELTLVDFAWIFAAIIVSLLICFCIVFFAKGANHLAATQTELLLRTPDPVAVARSSPESISETLDQSATVVIRRKSNLLRATHSARPLASLLKGHQALERRMNWLPPVLKAPGYWWRRERSFR